MKRHPSLIPLSREHHGALILSRLLQKDAPPYKGLPADPAGKAAYALSFYQDELLPHFAEEERIIPIINGIDAELDRHMETMVTEHAEIKKLFSAIPNSQNLPDLLDLTGKTMEAHIRKEERVIFPLIQEKCSEELLGKMFGEATD